MPFVSDLGTRDKFDMRFAVSRSGKTVSSKFVAFFIADDNTLHYRRNSSSFYVHIRRFADDKVYRHGKHDDAQATLQHGDVIAVSTEREPPSFYPAQAAYADMIFAIFRVAEGTVLFDEKTRCLFSDCGTR